MGALDQLESFLQELLERPTTLLGPRRLRPLELASALTKELESRARTVADRIVIPGQYAIHVGGDELAGLAVSVPALEREMTDYVQRFALGHDLVLASPASVQIFQDSTLTPGQIIVRSTYRARNGSRGPLRSSTGPDQGAGGARIAREAGNAQRGRPRQKPAELTARLVLLGADGSYAQSVPLPDPVATLGRRSDNDVALDDSKISRHHARIERRGREYWLTDLDSTNGTRMNGMAVHGAGRLRPGDIVELGLLRLRFEVGG